MSAIVPVPYATFFDRAGMPLDDGYIYIGTANLNPITNPISIYYDQAGTIAASLPLRTNGGYIWRNGAPARIYTNADFSIVVQESDGTLVYSSLSRNSWLNSETAGMIGFSQAATYPQGTVGLSLQRMVNVKDAPFNATGDGVTDDTAAINAAIAAAESGSTLFFPQGVYMVDPITITKQVRLLGQTTRQASVGSVIKARGDQTHVIMYKGGAGTFPTDFIDGIGFDFITIMADNHDISDAIMVLWNCGMGNSFGLNVTNAVGRAIRFKNAQDLHFYSFHMSDVGDNPNQKTCLYLDPTSDNNCNNIYFVDPHFESVGWTILEGGNGDDDQIQIIGGKCEMRIFYAGQTATDLTFSLFKIVDSNRFTCNLLTLTNTHIYSGATFLLTNGYASAVSGCKVFNVATQTSPFLTINGTASGYTVRDNGGYNIGRAASTSTKSGYIEETWWANNNFQTNRRAILDAISPPVDKLVSNAGGNFAYGISGSLTGKSFSFVTISDPQAGILVPIGNPTAIKVTWRLYSDLAAKTVSLGYRDAAGTYTAVRTGVAVSNAGFSSVDIVLTPTMLATAIEAVVIKEQADNNLYVDGAWLRYTDGSTSGGASVAVPAVLTNIGIPSNVSFFTLRHSFGASALVCADVNNGATIIYQAGGLFVAGAPAGNQIQFSVTGAGQMQAISGGTANTAVWFNQEIVQ